MLYSFFIRAAICFTASLIEVDDEKPFITVLKKYSTLINL